MKRGGRHNISGAIQASTQAVGRAKSTDADPVIKQLRAGNFDTVLENIGFDATRITKAGATASSTNSGVGIASTAAGRVCRIASSRSAPGNRAMAASVAATSATPAPAIRVTSGGTIRATSRPGRAGNR